MKKKILTLAALALFVAILLCSCSFLQGDQTPSGNNPSGDTSGGDTPAEENVKLTQLVLESLDLDVFDLRADIFDVIGMIPTVTDTEAAHKGEIVIGNTSRPITSTAKAELANLIADSGKVGYIIYYDGKSVSVYWQNDQLMDLALAKFNTLCVNTQKLVLKKGIIDSAIFSPAELARDSEWLTVEAKASPEIYQALRELDSLFNGSYMVEWFANLWDNENGGFYFSNSARDNEPFRPDLESTYQLINMLISSGASGGLNKNKFFPNEMKIKLVNFVKGMQSADNGYFLHPQWSQDVNALQGDRVGRDLQWATDILNFTVDTDGDGVEEKVYPNYCTPAGLKCEKHSTEGGQCDYSVHTVSSHSPLSSVAVAGMTVSLSESVSGAVSRVSSSSYVSATSVSLKPDFSSSAAFKKWVLDYSGGMDGFMDHSGEKHDLNAFQTEIFGRGFGDEMTEVLLEIQQTIWDYQIENGMTPSGVWQLEADLSAVAGIHKYMPFLNAKNTGATLDLEMAKSMVNTCLTVINTPLDKMEGGSGGKCMLNDLMNMWTGITHVMTNIRNAYGEGSPELEELYDVVRDRAVPTIQNAIVSLQHYSLGDGLFVFTYARRCLSAMYGCPASMGVEEADVNGMLMMFSMRNAVFNALGYGTVKLCTADDGANFLNIVKDLEPVEKIPVPEVEYKTFTGEDITALQSSNYLTSTVNSSDYNVDIVTDDITGSEVLYFKSGLGNSSNQADTIHLLATNTGGNCNVAEFDFRVVSVSKDSHIFQVTMGSGFMFMMYKSGQYLTISALTSSNVALGTDKLVTAEHKIRADEWHNMRIEVYDAPDGEVKPIIKLYIDNEHIATTNMFIGSSNSNSTYNSTYQKLSIYSCSPVVTELHLDNVYLNREYLELGEE